MGESNGRVGPYVLGPEIGRGTSGVVYEARDERLGRRVALRVLAEELAPSAEQRRRFEREAQLLAALQHPNIAAVYGAIEEDTALWLEMDRVQVMFGGLEVLVDAAED